MAAPSSTNRLDPDTTFVLADPDTFRYVVQRLTGAAADENNHRSSASNLHQRRPTAKRLELNFHRHSPLSSSARNHRRDHKVAASPVSPLEYAAARGSPTTPTEEEDMAIAAKGFYFHPNPSTTPAGSGPPELLPLFPLQSPSQSYESSSF